MICQKYLKFLKFVSGFASEKYIFPWTFASDDTMILVSKKYSKNLALYNV